MGIQIWLLNAPQIVFPTVFLLLQYHSSSHISQILFCGKPFQRAVAETILYLSLILWFGWMVFLVWAQVADLCSQRVEWLRRLEWLDSWSLSTTVVSSSRILAWAYSDIGRKVLSSKRGWTLCTSTFHLLCFIVKGNSHDKQSQWGRRLSKGMHTEKEVSSLICKEISQ